MLFMEITYSESVLASYVTYKELFANDNYKSPYQILAEFIKYIILTEDLYNFSIPELKKKISKTFGFRLPNAVIKSAIKKISFVESTQYAGEYGVNRQNVQVDQKFFQYKKNAEKINDELTEQLLVYAEARQSSRISKNELVQEFIAYLLDESNGSKYQEVISAFIVNNSQNEAVVNQLNAIREGAILYMGLNCNIIETGSITSDLTLYLDTEILFDIYGYNGEVFQNLAMDLLSLVKEANKSKKRIKLRYFTETKDEISSFFVAATEIVRNGSYIKENVAMKAIVNGCKDSTDVSDKESDFYHTLHFKYGILLDETKNYYMRDDYVANLEGYFRDGDSDTEISLRQLSHINKLRKNRIFYDYTKSEYLFVTQTWKTQELSNRIARDCAKEKANGDDFRVCGLAVNMSFLTNILWYKLNRGFGVQGYPMNLDSVIKAKIVLANFISQNVALVFDSYKKQYTEGSITSEQMAGRLLGLREKGLRPEDITVDNLEDNLNFDTAYLCRFEEKCELQRVQLEEKEEIIKQVTSTSKESLAIVQGQLDVINEKLEETKNVTEEQKVTIQTQDAIIVEQKAEIDEKNRLIAEYQRKDKRKKEWIEKIKKTFKFLFAILWRTFVVVSVGIIAYKFAESVKADAANAAGIVVGIVGTAISVFDIVKNVYHRIFEASK